MQQIAQQFVTVLHSPSSSQLIDFDCSSHKPVYACHSSLAGLDSVTMVVILGHCLNRQCRLSHTLNIDSFHVLDAAGNPTGLISASYGTRS